MLIILPPFFDIDVVLKTKVKLLQFLDESTSYKAERILSRLPVDSK